MNKKLFLLAILALSIFTQCEMFNPDEKIPAYIEIPDFTVHEELSAVTDAWVYIDENLVGIYALPAKFPVLYNGNHEITIRPGIKVNGIAVTRGYYTFYKPYTIDTTLTEAETITILPETQYKDNITFPWRETFESVAVTLEIADSLSIGIEKSDTVTGAPSAKVGVVTLLPDTTFRVRTVTQFTLPEDRAVYLEISYKSDYYFELAWQAENLINGAIYSNKIYQFNPSSEWTHVYLYLTNFIKDYNPTYHRFKFLLGSKNNQDKTQYIYLDNIRLLHF